MSVPNLVTKCSSPNILWYQTDITVIIRILLPDVNKYYLRVECDHLLFSTKVNSKNYYLCLYLFGVVFAEKTSHRNTGREIKITLQKAQRWIKWLRLYVERTKNPLINVDTDHIHADECIIKERESFTQFKLRNNITNIMPDVPSSDEAESDDEDVDMIFD
ncbi:uncharacterized protein LOC108628587 [Ceratina calcarata]|uniref:RNA helicase n=1 Tax=Ceratina calcarata TaxID=156304 RepID=A0AAJ7J7S1_9HYME|nr:uncharacterized protein LOC108628587 [Ceratina calcarata]